jgi:hypothetical protein
MTQRILALILFTSTPALAAQYTCNIEFGELVPLKIIKPEQNFNPLMLENHEPNVHKIRDVSLADGRILQTRYVDYKADRLSQKNILLKMNCAKKACTVDLGLEKKINIAVTGSLYDKRFADNKIHAEITEGTREQNRIIVRVFKEKTGTGGKLPASASGEISFENEVPYFELNVGADEQFDIGLGQTMRIEAAEVKLFCRNSKNP